MIRQGCTIMNKPNNYCSKKNSSKWIIIMQAKNNALNINIMYNINLQEDIMSCGINVLENPSLRERRGHHPHSHINFQCTPQILRCVCSLMSEKLSPSNMM